MHPTTKTNAIITGKSHVENKVITRISFPASRLNKGSNNAPNKTASSNDRKLNKTDSVKNCVIKCDRSEPATFLIPTSFARLAERAVERFIKLTQAISKIKMAITEKIYT